MCTSYFLILVSALVMPDIRHEEKNDFLLRIKTMAFVIVATTVEIARAVDSDMTDAELGKFVRQRMIRQPMVK